MTRSSIPTTASESEYFTILVPCVRNTLPIRCFHSTSGTESRSRVSASASKGGECKYNGGTSPPSCNLEYTASSVSPSVVRTVINSASTSITEYPPTAGEMPSNGGVFSTGIFTSSSTIL